MNNKLTGNAGANKLDGLGGDDTMDGRLGNDTYFVDSSNDKVSEDTLTGGGTDTVFSTANFTLNDNIENLTLLGAALTGTGNDGSNTITGNDLANTLDAFRWEAKSGKISRAASATTPISSTTPRTW